MAERLEVQFVSDVACPWCAIGWHAFAEALSDVQAAVHVTFEPFQLNPDTPAQGIGVFDYIRARTGMAQAQVEESWEPILARSHAVNYPMRIDANSRIYNTFDAHRLVAWADESGLATNVHDALFDAHFITQRNYGSRGVLADIAAEAGLDRREADAVLSSDAHRDEVTRAEERVRALGIRAVPTVQLNGGNLVPGSRSPEEYRSSLQAAIRSTPGG